MKYIGTYSNDADIATKANVDAKQDKVLVDGILKGDGQGAISAAETQEVELVTLTKADVGLGNVDNTSDANKPISTATQTALNGKQAKITASGILKGDGAGGVSAAVPGTDYSDPFRVVFTGNLNALTCNRTVAEIHAAYKASRDMGSKQLVANSPASVMNNITMVEDDIPESSWMQFTTVRCVIDDSTDDWVPVIDVINIDGIASTPFREFDVYAQPRIQLGSNGAIPKVQNSRGLADKFVAATPDTDYMTPSMGTSGAKVGQMLNVQAEDASGKPTKWETKDVPHGVPAVTASDNGKFLRVVDGVWAAATVENANGVSF